ncbi:MAG: ABC transporter substrate-binding protein [Nitrospinota bacterium]|nr:ABC transporter substrate-binding protein [Nitrospinota bacterium]
MRIKAAALAALILLTVACDGAKKPSGRIMKPDTPPLLSPSGQDEAGAGGLYNQAEEAYRAGNLEAAAELYKKFISTSPPNHPLMDNAYFKIGMCWFDLKRYRDALYFFNTVTSRFPDSESKAEARVNAAISLFYLNELKAAEVAFDQAMTEETRQDARAYILYYKGAIAEKRGDYNLAARFYIQGGLAAQDEGLLNKAQAEAGRLFENFLNEAQLDDIRVRYQGQWPAGLALSSLIRIYASEGQGEKLAAARAEYSQYTVIEAPSDEPTEEENYRPKDVKIGAVLPLSGPGSAAGREMIQGIQLALNSFIKLVKEKNIQLVVKDSGAVAGGAVAALEELAADPNMLAIIGPAYSEEFKGAAPISERARISIISPSASEEGAAALSRWLFRTALTNSVEAKRTAELAVNRLGLKRFVIIFAADRQGRELSQYFTREVESLGAEIVAAEAYTPEQNDFGFQIRQMGGMTDDEARDEIIAAAKNLKANKAEVVNGYLARHYEGKISAPRIASHKKFPLNPRNFLPGLDLKYDAIYLPGMHDKVGLILPGLEFYNIRGVTRLLSSGANHPGLVRIAEKYAEGVIFPDGFFAGSFTPQTQAFVHDYRLYFRGEPSIIGAQAHDAAVAVFSGLAQGAGTRFEVTRHLRSLAHFEGASGEMSVTPEGDMDKSVILLTVEAGNIIPFTIPEAPSAPPLAAGEAEPAPGAGSGGQVGSKEYESKINR